MTQLDGSETVTEHEDKKDDIFAMTDHEDEIVAEDVSDRSAALSNVSDTQTLAIDPASINDVDDEFVDTKDKPVAMIDDTVIEAEPGMNEPVTNESVSSDRHLFKTLAIRGGLFFLLLALAITFMVMYPFN